MLVVVAAVRNLLGKMIGDELRARVDDLPAGFVGLALRLLPPDMRDYYRPDWEGNLLVAFNDETSRYPVTRFFRSFKFGFSLMVGARQIRKETKFIQQAAKHDEQQERLVQALIGPGRPGIPTARRQGRQDRLEAADGEHDQLSTADADQQIYLAQVHLCPNTL